MAERKRANRAQGWRRWRHQIGSHLSDLQVLLFPIVRVLCLAWCWIMHHGPQVDRRGPVYDFIRDGKPCIVAFWHEDAFGLMFEMIRYTRGYPAFLLLSRGRIGKIVVYILRIWGLEFARGSDRHWGKQAVAWLGKQGRQGDWSFFLTGDGSRGPAHVARWGAVTLARDTGLPVIGARAWSERRHIFGDSKLRVAIPAPWGRAIVLSSEPLYVPRDADAEALEECRQELERRLNAIAEASDDYFRVGPEAAGPWGAPATGLEEAEKRRRTLPPPVRPTLPGRPAR